MTLYIVGTPIGNLDDITLRALTTLKEVDLIVAENVPQTKKLLGKYEIATPVTRLHQHSKTNEVQRIVDMILAGKSVAYVSDAGTPAISDPGGELVQLVREADVQVVPIPGASAVTTLLSVAGIPAEKFLFVGFLPKKKGRQTWLTELANLDVPIVLFESPNRVVKTLTEIRAKMGEREIIVGRELTKIHEEILRQPVSQLIDHFLAKAPKGEFVLIVQPDL